MKFIVGKKLDMTQVFGTDGVVVPVTRVEISPCVVTQVKNMKKDGVDSIQVGYGKQKFFRINKPTKGHLKDIKWDDTVTVRDMVDFKVEEGSKLERGHVITIDAFKQGEKVQVVGKSKGKGFQGVVKRHGFHGSPASHGHKDQLRMPGSIGATDAARVFKGTRMGGHMGVDRVTIKNLEIVEIKPEENIIFIKGAVPGARNGVLFISTAENNFDVESLKSMLKKDTENKEDMEVIEVVEDKKEEVEKSIEEPKEEVKEVKEESKEEVETPEVKIEEKEEEKAN